MHLGALGVFGAHSPTAGAHAADLLAARAAAVPGLRALKLAAGILDPVDLPERAPRAIEPPRGLLTDVRRLPGLVPGLVKGALSDVGRALDIGASLARSTLGMRPVSALTSEPTGT